MLAVLVLVSVLQEVVVTKIELRTMVIENKRPSRVLFGNFASVAVRGVCNEEEEEEGDSDYGGKPTSKSPTTVILEEEDGKPKAIEKGNDGVIFDNFRRWIRKGSDRLLLVLGRRRGARWETSNNERVNRNS